MDKVFWLTDVSLPSSLMKANLLVPGRILAACMSSRILQVYNPILIAINCPYFVTEDLDFQVCLPPNSTADLITAQLSNFSKQNSKVRQSYPVKKYRLKSKAVDTALLKSLQKSR